MEKKHRLISGRAVCVCVSEGEIRKVKVNFLRLQRAHVFILLPQVTKRELTVPASVLVWTCVFQWIQRTCFRECRVRLVQGDITLRQAVL